MVLWIGLSGFKTSSSLATLVLLLSFDKYKFSFLALKFWNKSFWTGGITVANMSTIGLL